MGFPVLLKATSGDLGSAGGVVILAVTLTRAPLLVPLTAMQGNLIAHFVDQRAAPVARAGGPAAVVAVLGVVGVLLAGLPGRGCCAPRSAPTTTPAAPCWHG